MKKRVGKFKYAFIFIFCVAVLASYQNCGKSALGGGAQIASVTSVSSSSDSPSDEPTTSEPTGDGPGVKNVFYCMQISGFSMNSAATFATYQGTYMNYKPAINGSTIGKPEALDPKSSDSSLVLFTAPFSMTSQSLPLTVLDDGTGHDSTTGRFSFAVPAQEMPINLNNLSGTFTDAAGYSTTTVGVCPDPTD